MKLSCTLTFTVLCLASSGFAVAQSIPQVGKSQMDIGIPQIGDSIGEYQLFDESGNPIRTTQLRDRYTVLVFGCLT